MTSSSTSGVPFKRPTVSPDISDWLTTATSRGLLLRVERDGRLHVSPRDRVQPDDLAFLRAHRESIIKTVAYLATVDAGPVQ